MKAPSNFYTEESLKAEIEAMKGRLRVGRFTYGRPQIFEWGEKAPLEIGAFCAIADGVKIFLGGEHRSDWVSTYPFSAITWDFPESSNVVGHPKTKGGVKIGNDVWIGYGATILSGVTIGDGAAVGAFAVVSKDVAPYSIIAGNPGKFIRFRFSESEIADLLNLAWSSWPLEKIKRNTHLLCSSDIGKLIREMK